MKEIKTWDDITVRQFVELKSITHDDEFQTISILLDIPLNEMMEMDLNEFNKLTNKLDFVNNPIKEKAKEFIETKAGIFYKIDLNKITLGEFLDLEHYFTNDYYLNLPYIIGIFYRKKENQNQLLFPDKFENYGDFLETRKSLFLDLPITYVHSILEEYLKFRSMIFKSCEGLFSGGGEKNDDDYDDEVKETNKWGWDAVVFNLTKNDITKIDEVYKTKLFAVLNVLSMKSELNIT